MASLINIDSLQLDYRTVLEHVLVDPAVNAPRGHMVFDAGHVVIQVNRPDLPQLPVETGRGVDLNIAAVEAIQLIAARDEHDLVLNIAPQFEKYTDIIGTGDDGNPYRSYFHGNYGRRMATMIAHDCGEETWHRSWVECAVHKIKNDRDTRQAVINLWDNDLDNDIPMMHDYPCTVAIGFRVFRGQLEMSVTMRSNDVWLGLPYDIFQFNQLHHTVANMLCVPLGPYTHTAWSMHMYETDIDKVKNVYDRTDVSNVQLPQGFTDPTTAAFVLNQSPHDFTPSEQWYVDRLDPYLEAANDAGAE